MPSDLIKTIQFRHSIRAISKHTLSKIAISYLPIQDRGKIMFQSGENGMDAVLGRIAVGPAFLPTLNGA